MTTIANVSATSTKSATSTTSTSSARIADNFDQFLQLLTTQLKNQSPLDPLDTNQFTQQLVQFASVEQQIKTNDNLSSLLTANKTANLTNALGFIGANVTADGTTTSLQNGSATWQINAPKTGSGTFTIKDKSGNAATSDFTHVIVAIGIVPNTENIGLEGLAEMDRGFIQIEP